ncbi:hypothetical protein K0B04_02410 [Patescibacteria group bacterium]|nr:hypothetical protein [Patescibacteria group bacterium]
MDFNNIQTDQLIKMGVVSGEIFILAIMVIYLVHAFILSRRIKIMNLNLKTPYAKSFSSLSRIHTIATIIIIIITVLSIEI